jgi:hypothetical protein
MRAKSLKDLRIAWNDILLLLIPPEDICMTLEDCLW